MQADLSLQLVLPPTSKTANEVLDLTREEVLEILEGMHVEIPRDTKLPLEALNQRVNRALDLSQLSIKCKELDPSTLKRWCDVPTSKVSLRMVLGTFNQGELDAFRHAAVTPMHISSFMSFRLAISEIGQGWNEGGKIVLLKDKENEYTIKVHFVDIFALSDDIPVIVFHYEHGPAAAFRGIVDAGIPVYVMNPMSFTTVKLLLKLFHVNSRRFSASYNPPCHTRSRTRKSKRTSTGSPTRLTLSFIVPVLPLSMREVGGLSNATGCEICGQLAVSRCAACQYTAYCSKACQKADWNASHRVECKKRALASGSWVSVDISTPGYDDKIRERANSEYTVVGSFATNWKKEDMTLRPAANWPPPNMYGDTPFVVKILGPELGLGGSFPLTVYDRRRSLEFFLHGQVDPIGYEALIKTLQKSERDKLKIHLFAKRTASCKLSVCLDRDPPAELIKW